MKNLKKIIIGSALILAVSVLGSSCESKKTYDLGKTGFEVELKGEYKQGESTERQANLTKGEDLSVDFIIQDVEDMGIGINNIDDLKKTLGGEENDSFKILDGKLLDEKAIIVSTNSEGKSIKIIECLVGNRGYSVMVSGKNEAEIDKVIEEFSKTLKSKG